MTPIDIEITERPYYYKAMQRVYLFHIYALPSLYGVKSAASERSRKLVLFGDLINTGLELNCP